MASHYMAQVVLRATSGLPEDNAVNTWHFGGDDLDDDPTAGAAIAGALANAYTTNHAGPGGSPDTYLANSISRVNKPLVKVYRRGVTEPPLPWGPPIYETTFAALAAAANASDLPREAAICLTFHANITDVAESIPLGPVGPAGDIRPASRLRGRIYFGPLNLQINEATGRPYTANLADISGMGDYLLGSNPLDPTSIYWAVYSRAANELNPVTGGWIDNEYDTQRRRGRDRTARTFFGTGS
jgi:hypothetical protein